MQSGGGVDPATADADMRDLRPVNVAEAVDRLRPAIFSVVLVDCLASRARGRSEAQPYERPSLRSRLISLALIAVLPLLFDSLLWVFDRGSSYPAIAWLFVYAAFAAYLMIVSSFIWTRLREMAPWIDKLLAKPKPREDVAAWIAKVSHWWIQLVICIGAASVSAAAMGLADRHYSSLRISWAWYLSTWLTVFLATDAVSWVLRFIALTARVGREQNLAVSTFAPVQTPAVRELREFAATIAVVTGLGLFFFATPLVWAVAYVLDHHQSAATLRFLSAGPFALTAFIALAAVFAPQFFISSFVKRERDVTLDRIDRHIPRHDPVALLDPQVERTVALFNSVAATRTTSVSMSALVKRTAGLLAPLAPLSFTLLANILGLAADPKATPTAHVVTCATCGAPTPALPVLPVAIAPMPAITTQLNNAEPLIPQTTPPAIASLALLYQPTVKMSIFDRFWPVSVAVVLREHDDGRYTCLVNPDSACGTQTTPPALEVLHPNASAGAYLDYPEPLNNIRSQFTGFMSALGFGSQAIGYLWEHPAAVDPYPWAQLYFYDAEKAPYSYPPAPPGLISLQYWFFYAFNYYPTIVFDRHAMVTAPILADHGNSDYHEGDWEHVTVLLDPKTFEPRWLWMARHSDEGMAIPWSKVTLDHGHPVIYPALGGHPSYQEGCRAWRRSHHLLFRLVYFADYVGCAPDLFTFSYETTPLVDLSRASWACWPGHFGKAGASLRTASNFDDPTGLYLVAGPPSPLRQAENAKANACRAS